MSSKPYRILACPRCGTLVGLVSLPQISYAVAAQYTDGIARPRRVPETPTVAKCRDCGDPFWLDDAPVVWEIGEPERPELEELAAHVEGPSDELLEEAITSGLATDRERELYLRFRSWWADGRDAADDGSTLRLRNMEALAALLDETKGGERLAKAELARQLGRFDEARRLIDHFFGTHSRHRVAVISRLIEQGRTEIAVVHGDEGFTEEQKQKKKESAEQARAAYLARNPEIAAVTAQRELALESGLINEGDRCPRCGFSYAWSGTACHHCHYPA